MDGDVWGIGCDEEGDMFGKKIVRFRFYLELEADVWLELHLKIYYKSYISFVCERKKKFLIFSIDFIFICECSWMEMYGVLGATSKGTCIANITTVNERWGMHSDTRVQKIHS